MSGDVVKSDMGDVNDSKGRTVPIDACPGAGYQPIAVVERQPFSRESKLIVGWHGQGFDNPFVIVPQPEMVEVGVREALRRDVPGITLTDRHSQQLIDSLWMAGFRPSQAVVSTGQVEAMNEHIKDLRKSQALLEAIVRADIGEPSSQVAPHEVGSTASAVMGMGSKRAYPGP